MRLPREIWEMILEMKTRDVWHGRIVRLEKILQFPVMTSCHYMTYWYEVSGNEFTIRWEIMASPYVQFQGIWVEIFPTGRY